MLTLSGKGSITTCDGITRRDFLQVGTLGALGFSLSHLEQLRAAGAVSPAAGDKAVIMIFNLGSPSSVIAQVLAPAQPPKLTRRGLRPARQGNA